MPCLSLEVRAGTVLADHHRCAGADAGADDGVGEVIEQGGGGAGEW